MKVQLDAEDPIVQGFTARLGGFSAEVTVTAGEDTVAMAAADVFGQGNGTDAGSAVLEFEDIGPAGGGDVLFTDAELWFAASDVPAGMTSWRLELHSAPPDSDLADAATFDLTVADQATYLGAIDLGTPVDKGSTLYVQRSEINMRRTLASASVFAYLVTVGPFTRAADLVGKVKLHARRV